MKKLNRTPVAHTTGSRTAFTLIEILVVLAILAILIGLLFPVLGGATKSARVMEVKSDMERLTSAITAFKLEFSVEPPGSLTLSETGVWTAAAHSDLPRSRAELRKIFPDFTFVATDFNGDGVNDPVVSLSGAECLVFFLGGMRDPTSGALDSFSTNPIAPFRTGGSRFNTFYDFGVSGYDTVAGTWTGRLVDLDGDGFPELLDTIPGQLKPYLYFSTYGGKAYRTVAGNPGHPSITVTPAWHNPENYNSASPVNGMPYPYYRTWNPASTGASVPHNKKSFQIISPGFDYAYGTGGPFNPDKSGSLLAKEDRDNIVNFHGGLLDE
ncbi:MAG: type II secretion system protein [Planctomycetes bacterium]|nr:type II secretion system protein [Planctomycetota bacterium]